MQRKFDFGNSFAEIICLENAVVALKLEEV